MKKIDHYGKKKHLDHYIELIKELPLSAKTKKALFDYHEKNKTKSLSSQQKSLEEAYWFFRESGKSIESITKKDVEKWWSKKTQQFADGEIKAETLRKKYNQIRKFFRTHHKMKKGRYPKIVDSIEWDSDIKEQNLINPSDLPTQEKIKELIQKAYNRGSKFDIRNQALLALLNDCGIRIGEALSINLKHISEENNYLVVAIPESKTIPRVLISYLAKPYLKKWLALHQPKIKGKTDYNAPLFIDATGKRMTYYTVQKAINTVLKKAQLQLPERKKTHLFRHLVASRAKNWSSDVKDYWFGWSGRMSNRYTHMDHRDCVKPYFEMIEAERNPMNPIECRCGYLNPNIDFCEKCGQDIKSLNILTKSPERKAKLLKEIIESVDEKDEESKDYLLKLMDKWWEEKKKFIKGSP